MLQLTWTLLHLVQSHSPPEPAPPSTNRDLLLLTQLLPGVLIQEQDEAITASGGLIRVAATCTHPEEWRVSLGAVEKKR